MYGDQKHPIFISQVNKKIGRPYPATYIGEKQGLPQKSNTKDSALNIKL